MLRAHYNPGIQIEQQAASFRDPAGYVFRENGVIKRLVTDYGAADYRQLIDSGLYERLVRDELMVAHEEQPGAEDAGAAAILVPEQIPFVSYPYEWSFGQVKDAALLTLRLQKIAMEHGMSLKDASAFNVQFRGYQPVFIDTLSFEPNAGGPWVAYNQFCRHFLAPLLLMRYVSPEFNQFWKASLDGFSLQLVSSLLPRRTYLRLGALLHIHLHARSQRRYEDSSASSGATQKLRNAPDRKAALIDSLQAFIRTLRPPKLETEWMHYYDQKAAHYSSAAEVSKRAAVKDVVSSVKPSLVFDLGGNVGEYSRIAAAHGAYTVCFDIDPQCVNQNYERASREKDRRILPLLLDLTNPSPDLGFALRERDSVAGRGQAGLVMALALMHHLRITGNVPLVRIARFLAGLGEHLLLEHVPKSDPMAQVLLRSRKDTFLDYTEEGFRRAFESCFTLEKTIPVAETERSLYLFRRRTSIG